MPDTHDGMSAAALEPPAPAPLRRCPGCHNQVTAHTPRCPVCGTHATAARIASAARWLLIVTAIIVIAWWVAHHR